MREEITNACPEDLHAVLTLLAETPLPRDGVSDHFQHFLVAPEFFPRFGFRRIAREEADSTVRGSTEFRTACGESAVCMSLDL